MTEAESIAALALKQAEPAILKTQDGREILILPQGMSKVDIADEHGLVRELPRYLKQAVTLQAVDSLADYINRFKQPDTVLFADFQNNSIVGVIDYHVPDGTAARAAHRASMALPYSEEWRIWTGASDKLVPQLDFARFIEENGGDIIAPAAADVLEAMRDLQARRKVNWISAVRTQTENENFEYTDETEMRTKGDVEVPTKFTLNIPVYFGEAPTEINAFLRWKVEDKKLHLGIKLHRAEHVRQAVFRQIVLAVADSTKCPVMFGKPS